MSERMFVMKSIFQTIDRIILCIYNDQEINWNAFIIVDSIIIMIVLVYAQSDRFNLPCSTHLHTQVNPLAMETDTFVCFRPFSLTKCAVGFATAIMIKRHFVECEWTPFSVIIIFIWENGLAIKTKRAKRQDRDKKKIDAIR